MSCVSDRYKSYQNKVVLVTGAASGFGKLLSEQLAEAGARLVLGDVQEEALATLVEQLRKQGGEVLASCCDVSKEADVKALVERGAGKFGRLDVAINNAGVGHPFTSLIDMTEEEMDRQWGINTKGVFFGLKHQIRQMLTQPEGGAILNVSSMAGLNGAPKLGAYVAAKHAVIGLTKTAAVEYGRKNIRVNAICPFFALTPLVTDNEALRGEDAQQFLAQGCPMKRLGEPEEIVSTMLMICSPENSYMNGQAIAVDGGVSAL